jgi:hypothetical protein
MCEGHPDNLTFVPFDALSLPIFDWRNAHPMAVMRAAALAVD